MTAEEFNALSSHEKWQNWKKVDGIWTCPRCGSRMSDGPVRCSPFPGAARFCAECNRLLTRRTGGGQFDPFNWALMGVPEESDVTSTST